MQEDKSAV